MAAVDPRPLLSCTIYGTSKWNFKSSGSYSSSWYTTSSREYRYCKVDSIANWTSLSLFLPLSLSFSLYLSLFLSFFLSLSLSLSLSLYLSLCFHFAAIIQEHHFFCFLNKNFWEQLLREMARFGSLSSIIETTGRNVQYGCCSRECFRANSLACTRTGGQVSIKTDLTRKTRLDLLFIPL